VRKRRIEGGAMALGILGLMRAFLGGIERRVAGGQAEIGGALENVEMLCLPCDGREALA
jgi:hypothetical protein